jgi:hypothetical protein
MLAGMMQSAWEEVGQLEKAAREATPSGTLTHSSAPSNVWENPPQSSPQLPAAIRRSGNTGRQFLKRCLSDPGTFSNGIDAGLIGTGVCASAPIVST